MPHSIADQFWKHLNYTGRSKTHRLYTERRHRPNSLSSADRVTSTNAVHSAHTAYIRADSGVSTQYLSKVFVESEGPHKTELGRAAWAVCRT